MAELATPAPGWRSSWLPAGAAAAAAMLVLVMLLGRAPEDAVVLDSAVATDLEILLDQDDLELIEELAFYAWLDEQPELKEVAGDDNGIG